MLTDAFPRRYRPRWSVRVCVCVCVCVCVQSCGAVAGGWCCGQESLKHSMLALLLHELRRRLPGVGIATFAAPAEVPLLADGFDFDIDPDGVRAMAIVDTDAPFRG